MSATPNTTDPNSPPSSPTGRPRALDDTKKDKIFALLATGSSLAEAARRVRCSATTIRREMRRDREFAELIECAEQRADADPLKAIYRAARKSWRAGVYLLQRNEARRDAAKAAQYLCMSQLRSYNRALVMILYQELRDDPVCHRLAGLLDAALNYTIREVAAGRSPFPVEIITAASPLARSTRARTSALADTVDEDRSDHP